MTTRQYNLIITIQSRFYQLNKIIITENNNLSISEPKNTNVEMLL